MGGHIKFCMGFAEENIKTTSLNSEHKRDNLIYLCRAIKQVAENNRLILDMDGRNDFQKEVNPLLKSLIDSEI